VCGRQKKGARCDTSRPLLKPSGPKIPHGAANPMRAKLVYSEVWRRRRDSAHSRKSRRRHECASTDAGGLLRADPHAIPETGTELRLQLAGNIDCAANEVVK